MADPDIEKKYNPLPDQPTSEQVKVSVHNIYIKRARLT